MSLPPYEPPPSSGQPPPPEPGEGPDSGPPPGYGEQSGYGEQAPYGQPSPYGQPPPYGQQPTYGSSSGYGTPPGYGAPPAYGAPPGYSGQPGWGPPQEDTTMAVLAHLSIFVFALMGPLVIYLVSKDSSPFTRHHAAEALNFHITLTIASIVSAVLVLLVVGFFMLLAVFVAGAVLGIVAAVAAGKREMYRYPLTIRFVH